MSQPFNNPFALANQSRTSDDQPERRSHQQISQMGPGSSHSMGLSVAPGISEGSIQSREPGGSVVYYSMDIDYRRTELFPSHGGTSDRNISDLLNRQSDYNPSEGEITGKYLSSESRHPVSDRGSVFNRASDELNIPSAHQSRHESLEQEGYAPTQLATRPKYTAETGEKVLEQFGLEKEDMVHLMTFPQEQLNFANLPNIMRQIRKDKDKRIMAAYQTKFSSAPPSSSLEVFTVPAHEGMTKEQSHPLQPTSNIFDYGHKSKYDGKGEDVETGSRVPPDNQPMMDIDERGHSHELLNKVDKTSALGFSCHTQKVSPSTPAPESSLSLQDELCVMQTEQTSQHIISPSLKDTDLRFVKSESVPSKQYSDTPPAASTPQIPFRSSHTAGQNKFGIIISDSKSKSSGSEGSDVEGQASRLQTEEQPGQQHPQNQQLKPPQQKQPEKQQQQSQKETRQQQQPEHKKQEKLPQPQEPQLKKQQDEEQQSHPEVPQTFPVTSHGLSVPPPPVGPTQSETSEMHTSSAKDDSKCLPTAAMIQDYLAFPRVFPHACSLCIKECASTSEWMSHQQSDAHTANCKTLRRKYPAWNGKSVGPYSDASINAKPPPSGPVTKHSRSERSSSPQRKRRRSRSLSSNSSTDSSRSRSSSRSSSSHSSHSYRRRRSTPVKRLDRRCSPSSRERRYSPRRSNDRWFSLRRSWEKRPSPRRTRGRSPLRRNRERISSPKRGQERSSSPQRRESPRRRSPDKRDRRSKSRDESERTHDKSSPTCESKTERAENLLKKLLEKQAGHLISDESTLDVVAKTLAPVLLAEMKKMKSTSGTKGSSAPPSSRAKVIRWTEERPYLISFRSFADESMECPSRINHHLQLR